MKISCTEYELNTDLYTFEKSVEAISGETVVQNVVKMTGAEIVKLGDKKLSHCTHIDIGAYTIWERYFDEDPADMLNQSVEL